MTRNAFSPPTHDEEARALAALALPVAEAVARWTAGAPVTVIRAERPGCLSWQYATVRLGADGPEARLPGGRGMGRYGPVPSTDTPQARVARMAVSFLTEASNARKVPSVAAGVYFLPLRLCESGCGMALSTPLSYVTGLGPHCSGRKEAERVRSEAKRAMVRGLTFGAPVAPVPAPVARCKGTCDVNATCQDCG